MQKYQLLWEEDHVFEVDAPSTDEYPLGSISADELREKYVYNLKKRAVEGRNAGEAGRKRRNFALGSSRDSRW